MILRSNEQLQKELEHTLLKPDGQSLWISKMQSGLEDNLEEWYAIKFCFKLAKNTTETYGILQTTFGTSCMNRALFFEWHNWKFISRLRVEEMREVKIYTTVLLDIIWRAVSDLMRKRERTREYGKEGRESVRDDERCGRSKEVNTPELIGQRVRVRVTVLRF